MTYGGNGVRHMGEKGCVSANSKSRNLRGELSLELCRLGVGLGAGARAPQLPFALLEIVAEQALARSLLVRLLGRKGQLSLVVPTELCELELLHIVKLPLKKKKEKKGLGEKHGGEKWEGGGREGGRGRL